MLIELDLEPSNLLFSYLHDLCTVTAQKHVNLKFSSLRLSKIRS